MLLIRSRWEVFWRSERQPLGLLMPAGYKEPKKIVFHMRLVPQETEA